MARDGTLRVRIVGDARPLQKTLGGALGRVGKFAAAAGAIGGAAVAGVVAQGIGAAREAIKIDKLTEQVIKTTGKAANVTFGHVEQLASNLQAVTGQSDELVQSGANLLLTFTNIRNEVGKGNDIFDRATATALDMSVALGQDMKSSAIQLGKALNDPVKGVTALQRVGVSFTEAQRDQIKTLVESGDTLAAQKVILDELGKQFGGAAEAAADPLQKLSAVWGDIVEVVGRAALPVLDTVATFLAKTLPKAVKRVQQFLGGLGDTVGGIGAPLEQWRDIAVEVFDTAVIGRWWDLVQNVIGSFRDGLDRNAGKVAEWRERIGRILTQLRETFRAAWDAIAAIVGAAVKIAQAFWDRFGRHIVDFAVRTFGRLQQVIEGALKIITGIFDVVTGILTGDWARAWDGIKGIVSGAWNVITGVVTQAFDTLKTIFGGAVAVISQVWSGLWAGIRAAFTGAINLVIEGINAFVRFWNGLDITMPAFTIPGTSVTLGGFTIGLPDLPQLARIGAQPAIAAVGPRVGGVTAFQHGGFVRAGAPVLGVIGEGRDDELVSPVPTLRRLLDDALAARPSIVVQAGTIVTERQLEDLLVDVLNRRRRNNPSLAAAGAV